MTRARTAFYSVTFAVLAVLALNFQWVADQYYLRAFHPSSQMGQIITELKLTASAKGIMYRGRPVIDDKKAFNLHCDPSRGELELGCFVNGRIYVLKISNTDLASEMEVVTAHEFLHDAYTRLSRSDRQRVNTLLEQAAGQIQDADLSARLAEYAKTEPGERGNELHSILGTEYGSLPPALEQYYSRYFTDRNVVVQAHAQYQTVFNNRRAQIDRELVTIRGLKAELNALNGQMTALKAEGSISAYNALVPRQNALVDQVNNLIAKYNTDVEEYNALSQSLNSQQITPQDL